MVSRRIEEINDIVPFYYSCVECGAKGSFHGYPFLDTTFENDLQDWIDTEDLDKCLLFKDNYKAKELIKNIFKGETSAIISKLAGKCSKCKSELDLNVWVKFHVYDQEDNLIRISVENTVLLDGTGLIVESIPGFYRGVDIASGLHKLYLRWWFLEGDIYVFCPFIEENNYKYFDDIGNDILITYNCLKENSMNRQPFKMITARNHLWDYKKRQRTTIKDRVCKFMKSIESDRDYMLGGIGEGVSFLFRDSLYGVKTLSPENKSPENFKTYFHAKMYGAVTQFNRAEMVLTSYNYVAVETMQLESLSFADVDKEAFMKQVYKFQDDPHLKIEKIDLKDI